MASHKQEKILNIVIACFVDVKLPLIAILYLQFIVLVKYKIVLCLRKYKIYFLSSLVYYGLNVKFKNSDPIF